MSTPQIFDFPQYSSEWWDARRGVPSASNFGRIITPAKGELSKSAGDYIAELIADKHQTFIPFSTERGLTREMADGINREPEARDWYAMERNVDVRQVGFIVSACGRFGCSPDSLVGDDGGLELKCPTLKTQVKYLIDGGLPDEYKAQVHGSLIVSGRDWWDFASYAPGLPPLLLRIEPDSFTEKLRDALEEFHERYLSVAQRIAAM